MTQILAGIDASAYTAAICDCAGWAAERLGLGVQLLHVVQRQSAVTERHDLSGAIGLGVKSDLLEELTTLEEAQGKLAVQSGRALLESAARRITQGRTLDVESVLVHGGIVETLLERGSQAALILMGKRGGSAGFASAHLGSKIERVLRATRQPLGVCPDTFSVPAQVVLAYDGSETSSRALDWVTQTPLLADMPVHVVLAGPDDAAHQERLDGAVRCAACRRPAGRSAPHAWLARPTRSLRSPCRRVTTPCLSWAPMDTRRCAT